MIIRSWNQQLCLLSLKEQASASSLCQQCWLTDTVFQHASLGDHLPWVSNLSLHRLFAFSLKVGVSCTSQISIIFEFHRHTVCPASPRSLTGIGVRPSPSWQERPPSCHELWGWVGGGLLPVPRGRPLLRWRWSLSRERKPWNILEASWELGESTVDRAQVVWLFLSSWESLPRPELGA